MCSAHKVWPAVMRWIAAVVLAGGASLSGVSAATTRPADAVSPQEDERSRNYAIEALARRGLPTDIPLPERTPYDSDPEERERYLDGYRVGFADGLLLNHSRWLASEEWGEGKGEGWEAGSALREKRATAETERLAAFTRGETIGVRSPAAERALRDSFGQFRERLLGSIEAQFPPGMRISGRESSWDVVAYTYDDYSGLNSGPPVRHRAVKARCAFELLVSPDAVEDTAMAQLKGSYILLFDLVEGSWTLDMQQVLHTQRAKRAWMGFVTIHRGAGGELVVDHLGKAIAHAAQPAVDGQ